MDKNIEKKVCIVKSNKDIKQLLFDRITELGLTYTDIIKDAREKHGRKFTLAMLSRYFNFSDKQLTSQLTQENVLWLCDRYGIEIKIMVKKLQIKNKSIQQKIKRKYQ